MQILSDRRRLIPLVTALLTVQGLSLDPIGHSKSCFAQSTPGPSSVKELQTTIDRLIEKLDSNERAVRVSGERDLVGLGPEILPSLSVPQRFSSASVRGALRRIRTRLERQKALESIRAGRVTLRGTFPVHQILRQLSRQTANPIMFDDLTRQTRDRLIGVDWDRLTFWQALDDLLSTVQIQLTVDLGGANGIRLRQAESASTSAPMSVAYSGGFRIAVGPVKLRPIFGDQHNQLLNLPLHIQAEPRLRPLFLKYKSKDITLKTKADVLLEPFDLDANYELPLGIKGRRLSRSLSYRLPIAVPIARLRLQGRLVMLTAAGTEKITFRDLSNARGVSRRRGGVVVKITTIAFQQTSEKEYSAVIGITVTYDTGGPAFESHRTWMYHNDVYLESDAGRRIQPKHGFETQLQLDGAVAVVYRFQHLTESPAQYRFVYIAPTLLIDVPIEFNFRSIEDFPSTAKQVRP